MRFRYLSIYFLVVIMSATVFVTACYARGGGHGGGMGGGGAESGGNYDGGGYGSMHGGGMMGGSGTNYEYGHMPDSYHRNENNSNMPHWETRDSNGQIERLNRQINEKRRELSDLYRSTQPDEEMTSRKTGELQRLEQQRSEAMAQ